MTGAWARACDLRMERLTEPEDWSEPAAYQLAFTIWVKGPEGRKSVEKAGAYIRAWRKSLPDQGERWPDVTGVPTERLLWLALDDVCIAQWCWTTPDPSMAADHLRVAEAALRTWWKRSREEQP